MSNGYLVVAEADREAAYALAEGFDLDVIGVATLGDHEATSAALAQAANVGLVLSNAAAADAGFVALARVLASRLGGPQLIVRESEARAAFDFLPESWPSMPFALALERASDLTRRRQAAGDASEPPHAAPLPPAEEPAPIEDAPAVSETPAYQPEPQASEAVDERPAPPEPQPEPQPAQQEEPAEQAPPESAAPPPDDADEVEAVVEDETVAEEIEREVEAPAEAPPPEQKLDDVLSDEFGAEAPAALEEAPVAAGAPAPVIETPPAAPMPAPAPSSAPPEPDAPPPRQAPSTPDGAASPPLKKSAPTTRGGASAAPAAPADATAFAPKKVRRGTPELVRIAIHQPKDLQAVIKAARKIDPRAEPAPQGMSIGDVALGASVGVSLEVRGAACDGAVQRRTWRGEPIDFNFSIEADADVKQIVVLARVFVDDAQIGVLAFTRPVIGADKKPQDVGDKVRMKRHKRVFLSYSSKDRETVAAIATAYASAGVEHFWDRASLKSGEEWSPRLRKEIERADLFHLCWSKSAAGSEWVEKEANYALTRRRRSNGKKPDITVQMLDGPPWAKHPDSLDSINFDDFVRAAIVGYARGDGET